MGNTLSRSVSRRRLLALFGSLALSASAGTALAACGESPRATPTAAETPEPADLETAGTLQSGESIGFESERSVTLNGAGASFPFPLYSKLASLYNRLNPGIRINYQSIGSGGGIRQMIEGTVHFGATDSPMTAEQEAQAGTPILHIPTAMGAVVASYNLPDLPDLRLSPEVLTAIFQGDITRWSDPSVAADNPDAALPDIEIAVVHRADGSGTTFIWTDYLSSVSDAWRTGVGAGTSVDWPVGLGAKGNEGVAAQIRQIPGAVGYVELAYAKQSKLRVALVRNRDGQWVAATLESVSAAAAGLVASGGFPADLKARVVDPPGRDSYPIASFTWLLIHQDPGGPRGLDADAATELLRFVFWALNPEGGQQAHAALDYAPLDPEVIALAEAKLKTVTLDGALLWRSLTV